MHAPTLLAVALLVCAPAGAAAQRSITPDSVLRSVPDSRWMHVGAGERYDVYVDRRSLAAGARRTAWVMHEFHQAQDARSGRYDRVRARVEYDCPGRRSRLRAMIQYLDGEVVASADWDEGESEWTEVVPESVGEMTMDAVCGYQPRP